MVRIQSIMIICACTGVSLALTGCGPGGFEIGPVQMSVPLGTGTLDPAQLSGSKTTIVHIEQNIYNLPTEEDITELLKQASSIDLSGFVTITRLELVETELRALAGSFSFVSEITLSYVPKPVNGVAQAPVLIGTASAPGGFGSAITLQPVQGVDLLALILENDANPAAGYPKVRFDAALLAIPTTTVTWSATVDVDAYASISFAKVE